MNAVTKAILIINPISGTASKEQLPAMADDLLGKAGFDIEVMWTSASGDATRMASEAVSRGCDAVLVAGGDGTVNETAKALCDTPTALGIIPVGSGNGLARHLGIPVDAESALRIIARNHIEACDYGTVNQSPFFCTFGVGLDALVSHNFAKQSRRGLITYINSLINEYVKYHPETYTISANGKILTEKAMVIACCNASQYGNNVYIAPEASMTDGLLDITIIHQGTPIDTALVGMDLITGHINHNTLIHTLRAPSAVIYRTKPGPAHIDGEPVNLDEILEVKCRPHALHIYTSGDDRPFTPYVTPTVSFWKEVGLNLQKAFTSLWK